MLNLLRADLFRTLRSTSFWVWTGVVVVLLAFVVAMLNWVASPEFAQMVNASISDESIQTMTPDERADALVEAGEAMQEMNALNDKVLDSLTASWSNTFLDGGLLGIAGICFVVIYLLADFKHGFIKNLPMDRRGRTRYYASKLVYVALIQAVFLLVCAVFTSLFFAIGGFTYAHADTVSEIALWLLLTWLTTTTYALICCVLAWAVRSDAIGTVAAVVIGGGVLGAFLQSLLGYLGSAMPFFAELSRWLPVDNLALLRHGAEGLFASTGNQSSFGLPLWGHVIMIAVLYIAVSCIVTLLVCRKRDIR